MFYLSPNWTASFKCNIEVDSSLGILWFVPATRCAVRGASADFVTLRAAREAMISELRESGTIAAGHRSNWEYQDRFNLSSIDVDLLRQQLGSAPTLPQTPEVAWGQYVRFMLQPGIMYQCAKLRQV
ncbi:unnamed protein product [Prorocentrum cordatum]|uniref:Uncharacterized protein n=1 Tax=Prorocentrum cordatum TaxID=2364126 RepID=A0ABN9RN88_9DINO|nr:unnamed protein product [Polarella glacialis]